MAIAIWGMMIACQNAAYLAAICDVELLFIKGRQTGVFQTGVFPDLDLFVLFCPFLSLFVLFGAFPIFPGFPDLLGDGPGIFPIRPFSSFSAYRQRLRGTVPKGSATQSGPFPKKVGNPPVWKHPGLASPKFRATTGARVAIWEIV